MVETYKQEKIKDEGSLSQTLEDQTQSTGVSNRR